MGPITLIIRINHESCRIEVLDFVIPVWWKIILSVIWGGEAGLVGLVVLRDVGLVGGAVYKRACALGWEVSFFLIN